MNKGKHSGNKILDTKKNLTNLQKAQYTKTNSGFLYTEAVPALGTDRVEIEFVH